MFHKVIPQGWHQCHLQDTYLKATPSSTQNMRSYSTPTTFFSGLQHSHPWNILQNITLTLPSYNILFPDITYLSQLSKNYPPLSYQQDSCPKILCLLQFWFQASPQNMTQSGVLPTKILHLYIVICSIMPHKPYTPLLYSRPIMILTPHPLFDITPIIHAPTHPPHKWLE